MDNGAEELRDDIAAIEVAMLTTPDEHGDLVSCPLYTLQLDKDGVLWFFARRSTISSNDGGQVNLSYADPNSHTYISICGHAACREDAALKEKFWSPLFETWFPQGVDHPDLCLLAVSIERADIWSTDTAKMETLVNLKRTI